MSLSSQAVSALRCWIFSNKYVPLAYYLLDNAGFPAFFAHSFCFALDVVLVDTVDDSSYVFHAGTRVLG